ncbi:WD40 repeat-like protein [Aureobasidium subglaciale]|nr:WD40 repeat-like protein [Aureobasidium subglaciale]
MSLRAAPSTGFLQSFLAVASASLRPAGPSRSFLPLGARLWPAPLLPSIVIPIPILVTEIWESILKAVPKKKTSHMKKRHRQMAGKGLKDVTSLNKCSGCGRVKRAHYLCPHCVMSIKKWFSNDFSPKREMTEWEKEDQKKRMDQRKYVKDEQEGRVDESKTDASNEVVDRNIPDASPADIYSVAATSKHLITASGSSSLHVYSTDPTNDENNPYPLIQTLQDAHKLGAHHIAVSANGNTAASAGFGGEVKVWALDEESSQWTPKGSIVDDTKASQGKNAGEIWAVALSEDGQFLAATTFDGRINVWDLNTLTDSSATLLRSYETKGSFGMSVALSSDGEFTASGHANGAVYLFNNTTGRLAHSLQGLVKPVRTVAFSPASKFLAAGGDAKVIALYDVKNGEQVANLTGSQSWIMSLDWSSSGEHLLSGAYDGKAKVWSVERRECVATQTESDKTLWAVKWLPKTQMTRNETFVTVGANRSISFYREASGG